jgi:hypothetical protein
METAPNSPSDDATKKRFLWGVLLAWVPFLFFVLNALREISTQKATGLEAVAGRFTEAFATFGFAASAALPVTAIVLLLRALSKEHPTRTFFAILSICCSALTLSILALCLWFFFRLPHP